MLCPGCRNKFDTCSICWGDGYVDDDYVEPKEIIIVVKSKPLGSNDYLCLLVAVLFIAGCLSPLFIKY